MLTKEQERKAFQDLIDIMNLHDIIDADDYNNVHSDQKPGLKSRESTDVTALVCDASALLDTPSSVQILPNLSDDAKADLMDDGGKVGKKAFPRTVWLETNDKGCTTLEGQQTLRHRPVKPGHNETFAALKVQAACTLCMNFDV